MTPSGGVDRLRVFLIVLDSGLIKLNQAFFMSERKENGQFQKGISGNPRGRPKTDHARLRKSIAGNADELVSLLFDHARQGDVTAAKALLDRVVPSLKPVHPPQALPVPEACTVDQIAVAAVQAAALGQFPPDQAQALLSAARTAGELQLLGEIAQRLDRLEAA